MESHFNKALIPAAVLKRTPSLAFSSAYTYFNTFVLCFISIEPSIFGFKFLGFRTDQYLFNSPNYFNSKMLKLLNKEKVNKKKHVQIFDLRSHATQELQEIGV